MKFEDQVVSLELSKKLKEAGYPQKGIWWWSIPRKEDKGKPEIIINGREKSLDEAWGCKLCVASTVAELGEKLPKIIKIIDKNGIITEEYFLQCYLDEYSGKLHWCIRYIELYYRSLTGKEGWAEKIFFGNILVQKHNEKMSDAFSEMWLYLKKEGLIK